MISTRTALLLSLLIILLINASCTDSQPAISPNEAEQTMNNFFTALSTTDSTLIREVTTDDFTLYEHEEIWNRDSLLSLMPYTGGRIWEIKDFKSISEGDLAHVHYYNVSRKPADRSWLESALLIRDEGRLKIRFMHSTKLYLNK